MDQKKKNKNNDGQQGRPNLVSMDNTTTPGDASQDKIFYGRIRKHVLEMTRRQLTLVAQRKSE